MNGLLLCLAVFLSIVAGLASYVLPFSDKARRTFCSVIIVATTVIAWAAILSCSGEEFVLWAFTDKLSFDLSRRDFTVNAMAYNDKEGIIDLYGGFLL